MYTIVLSYTLIWIPIPTPRCSDLSFVSTTPAPSIMYTIVLSYTLIWIPIPTPRCSDLRRFYSITKKKYLNLIKFTHEFLKLKGTTSISQNVTRKSCNMSMQIISRSLRLIEWEKKKLTDSRADQGYEKKRSAPGFFFFSDVDISQCHSKALHIKYANELT